jgi:pyruvate dehydrogenase E2 component (dihydrolipoamide acetyltransferase)
MASTTQVLVPDIGGFKDVEVIDVLVKAGQEIDKETPMVTIETEKAAMDVPAPAAGRVVEVKVRKGDKVSEGSVILSLESTESAAAPEKPATREDAAVPEDAAAPPGEAAKTAPPAAAAQGDTPPDAAEKNSSGKASEGAAADSSRPQTAASQTAASQSPEPPRAAAPHGASPIDEKAFSTAYASPSVRKFARELGADLGQVKGTGPKGRITHEDVKAYVKCPKSTSRCSARWRPNRSRAFS